MATRGRWLAALAASSALAALVLTSAGSAGAAREGGGACANSTQPATQVPVGELKKAILCLINDERKSRGRSELDRHRKLAKVAGKHVKVMVETACLDHVCGNEAPVGTRIRNTGYFSGARDFDFGEDVGCRRSAAEMVDHWMGSTLHRRNILERRFDDIGVGVDHGRVEGSCAAGYATFVVIFGHRAG